MEGLFMKMGDSLAHCSDRDMRGACFLEVAGRITKVETVNDLVDAVLKAGVGDAAWSKPFRTRAAVLEDLLDVLESDVCDPCTWFLSASDCHEHQRDRMRELAKACVARHLSVTWHDGDVFWANVPKWKGWKWFPAFGPREATASVYDIAKAAEAGRKGIRQLLLDLERAAGGGPEFEKGLRATKRVVEAVRRLLEEARNGAPA